MASYFGLTEPAEPSSDGDVAVPMVAKDGLMSEIRAARRSAAVALGVAVVTSLLALGALVQRESTAQNPPETWSRPADTPLAQLVQEEPRPGLGGARGGWDGTPGPYHLALSSVLRTGASSSSAPLRLLPAGRQVLALKHHRGWVHVMVPRSNATGSTEAASGWLPSEERGVRLLWRDARVQPQYIHYTEPETPPTPEEAREKWENLRMKNEKLKATLAAIHASFKDSVVGKAHHEALQVRKTATQAAEQVFKLRELQKAIHQLKSGVDKGLHMPPSKLFHKVEDALAE